MNNIAYQQYIDHLDCSLTDRQNFRVHHTKAADDLLSTIRTHVDYNVRALQKPIKKSTQDDLWKTNTCKSDPKMILTHGAIVLNRNKPVCTSREHIYDIISYIYIIYIIHTESSE